MLPPSVPIDIWVGHSQTKSEHASGQKSTYVGYGQVRNWSVNKTSGALYVLSWYVFLVVTIDMQNPYVKSDYEANTFYWEPTPGAATSALQNLGAVEETWREVDTGSIMHWKRQTNKTNTGQKEFTRSSVVARQVLTELQRGLWWSESLGELRKN